eukprot:1159063-Pelagomonas_calceolata.AAC.9
MVNNYSGSFPPAMSADSKGRSTCRLDKTRRQQLDKVRGSMNSLIACVPIGGGQGREYHLPPTSMPPLPLGPT